MVCIFESDACWWMFLCCNSNENQALEDLKKPPEDPLKLWKFYEWIFWNFLETYICANPTLLQEAFQFSEEAFWFVPSHPANTSWKLFWEAVLCFLRCVPYLYECYVQVSSSLSVFFTRHRARIRGLFSAVTRPVAVGPILAQGGFQEKLFHGECSCPVDKILTMNMHHVRERN